MSTYHDQQGEAGKHAAENTKSAFKHLGDTTESLRKNINAYADNIVPGERKTTPHSNYETTPHSDHATTPHSDHATTPHSDHATTHTYEHESTGIHPDAKRVGDGLVKGAGAAAGKIDGFLQKHGHKKA